MCKGEGRAKNKRMEVRVPRWESSGRLSDAVRRSDRHVRGGY